MQVHGGQFGETCGVPAQVPLLQVSLPVQGSLSLQLPGTVAYWQTPLVHVPICSKHCAAGGVSLRAERAILARRNAPPLALRCYSCSLRGASRAACSAERLSLPKSRGCSQLSYDGRHRSTGRAQRAKLTGQD